MTARRLFVAASLSISVLTAACGPELAIEEIAGEDEIPAQVTPQSIPSGYYSAASGKTGTDLLVALSSIISAGTKSYSYSAARDKMFADLEDIDNNNEVDCVYTGRIAKNVSSTSNANTVRMNTEHTWPQSLGARGVAQSDMHHLWASDNDANSRRGNFPFGVVKTVTWTAPNPDGTPPSKLGKDDARLDWQLSATELARKIRAFNPVPGAWTLLNGEPLKIWRATPDSSKGKPGEVLAASAEGLVVGCGEGAIKIMELQRAGARCMDAATFLSGLKIPVGTRLGN